MYVMCQFMANKYDYENVSSRPVFPTIQINVCDNDYKVNEKMDLTLLIVDVIRHGCIAAANVVDVSADKNDASF